MDGEEARRRQTRPGKGLGLEVLAHAVSKAPFLA